MKWIVCSTISVTRRAFLYKKFILSSLIVIWLASAGCSGGGDGRHSFRIQQDGDVTIAETTGGPRFDEPLFTFEVELTLKEDPERPESMLFRPGTVHMDENGMFYVVDRGDGRVAVFDQRGEYTRSFGRKGEGPGEFTGMNMLRLSGGVMSIFDYFLNRTTRYRTDGTLLEVYRAPGQGTRGGSVERLDDGRFLTWPSATGEGPNHPVLDYTSERIVVAGASGDTLCDLQTPWIPYGYRYQLERGGGMHRMEYAGDTQLLFFPERGILMSLGTEPLLTWYNLDGQITHEIRLGLDPIPVTPEERARVRERAREEYEVRREARPEQAKASFESLQIPDEKAFWDNAFLDDSGYYWLHVPEPYEEQIEIGGPLCRVLSPEGEYLGFSRWPLGYGTFRDGRFMGIAYDEETGAAVPTVYRIIPVVSGLVYP